MSYTPLAIQRFVPTTGQTIVVLPSESSIVHVVIDPTITLAALSITIPTPTINQKVIFSSTQAITLITITGGVLSLTTLSLNANAGFVYNLSTATWFKVQ